MQSLEPREAEALFARACAGESGAFAALVRLHQARVFGIAARMLSDRAAAEDLAQDVFLQMFRDLASLDSHEHLRFWLRRVTSHRCIDRLRQSARISLQPLDCAREVVEGERGEGPLLRQHLNAVLQELAPAARAVLLLRYQEDLDPAEIARTLAMPVNTVKSHLKRSLSVLRSRLAGLKLLDRPLHE